MKIIGEDIYTCDSLGLLTNYRPHHLRIAVVSVLFLRLAKVNRLNLMS